MNQIDAIFRCGDGALSPDDKRRALAQLRETPETAAMVDAMMIERLGMQHGALLEARKIQRDLECLLEKCASPPWFHGTFLAPMATSQGPRAYVQHGNMRRIVALGEGAALDSFAAGDDIYLSRELNLLLGKAPSTLSQCGETCHFERRTPDGRFVVRVREEEIIVNAPPALREADVKTGDLLRWDREALVAKEKIERGKTSHCFVEESPAESFADIGGLGAQIKKIQRALLLGLKHPEIARKYHLRQKGGILLHGPTGTGKTMMARAIANWLGRELGVEKAFFMNIKPSALHSVWYSQSEANYRELFRVAREVAAAHPGIPVVMFFDEIDCIGVHRGQSHMRVHDNVLTSLIAELDGLIGRGNIIVIAATNRRDALDPALVRPGRLGDLVVEVPRPNRRAAFDIFSRHLGSDLPYARNGHGDDLQATRAEIIETAVSRIFAPNGSAELATITFRDGTRRPVRMPDLINGAMIANIAGEAVERACLREHETGADGVMFEDVEVALLNEFENAARILTPANCRNHLSGLPHDMDIVNVQPVEKKVARPGRYINSH
ncbi:MAG: proteasome-associated ATPase [Verrucomicrobiota bacterium]|jgi:proteasome ATPase